MERRPARCGGRGCPRGADLGVLATADSGVREGVSAFEFTGAPQAYLVPAGVCRVRIEAVSAAGGERGTAGSPGFGATALATLRVSPGETLLVRGGGCEGVYHSSVSASSRVVAGSGAGTEVATAARRVTARPGKAERPAQAEAVPRPRRLRESDDHLRPGSGRMRQLRRSRNDGQNDVRRMLRVRVDRLLGDDLVRVPADRLAGVRVALEAREVRRRDVERGSGGPPRRGSTSAAAGSSPATTSPGSSSTSRSNPSR